jgi:hypothetical protein
MRLTEAPATTVANMKNDDHVSFNGEQHPNLVWLAAI